MPIIKLTKVYCLVSQWYFLFFKSVNIWQIYKQERGCLMHFVRLANILLKTKKLHEKATFLLVILHFINNLNNNSNNNNNNNKLLQY